MPPPVYRADLQSLVLPFPCSALTCPKKQFIHHQPLTPLQIPELEENHPAVLERSRQAAILLTTDFKEYKPKDSPETSS